MDKADKLFTLLDKADRYRRVLDSPETNRDPKVEARKKAAKRRVDDVYLDVAKLGEE